jgi:hypothetical protein
MAKKAKKAESKAESWMNWKKGANNHKSCEHVSLPRSAFADSLTSLTRPFATATPCHRPASNICADPSCQPCPCAQCIPAVLAKRASRVSTPGCTFPAADVVSLPCRLPSRLPSPSNFSSCCCLCCCFCCSCCSRDLAIRSRKVSRKPADCSA